MGCCRTPPTCCGRYITTCLQLCSPFLPNRRLCRLLPSPLSQTWLRHNRLGHGLHTNAWYCHAGHRYNGQKPHSHGKTELQLGLKLGKQGAKTGCRFEEKPTPQQPAFPPSRLRPQSWFRLPTHPSSPRPQSNDNKDELDPIEYQLCTAAS